jgi:hypothetical protein
MPMKVRKEMTEIPTSPEDPYAHLRHYAARQKQATVDRLRRAIMQLERAKRPVTTFTIKEVSGLDYMAYYRNGEALALFRHHSTHLRKQRESERARRKGTRSRPSGQQETQNSSRDPLLNYKKPRLVTELRLARSKLNHLEQQYQVLLQEHMSCGLTIARLQTQLAEHQAFLERFRSSLQKEEHGPQR